MLLQMSQCAASAHTGTQPVQLMPLSIRPSQLSSRPLHTSGLGVPAVALHARPSLVGGAHDRAVVVAGADAGRARRALAREVLVDPVVAVVVEVVAALGDHRAATICASASCSSSWLLTRMAAPVPPAAAIEFRSVRVWQLGWPGGQIAKPIT
jgi:hypothetical protein